MAELLYIAASWVASFAVATAAVPTVVGSVLCSLPCVEGGRGALVWRGVGRGLCRASMMEHYRVSSSTMSGFDDGTPLSSCFGKKSGGKRFLAVLRRWWWW